MAQTQPASPPNPAEIYETVMVQHVFGPLAAETIPLATPKPGDRILDVATGTGIVLRQVAGQVENPGRLAGIDINPALIAVGRSIAEAQGLQIEWHEGAASEMPYSDDSFDFAFCQQGLQFFQDKHAELAEMRRVLANGGKLVAGVWQSLERHPYFKALDEAGFQHSGVHIFRDPYSLGDAGRLRELVEASGFRDVQIKPVSVISRWGDPLGTVRLQIASATAAIPSLRGLSDAQRADVTKGILSIAGDAIEEHTIDGALTVEWHANVAIAEK